MTMTDRSASRAGKYPEGVDRTRKTRVLLVDDEDRFRRSLAERLARRNIEVQDVARGEDAVRAARLQRPDVVLLDIVMPGMRGEEVLRQIKRIAPEIQVVMLTGHASIPSATATGRLDAFAYLEKPCDTDVLLETIEAAREERNRALARREMEQLEERTVLGWLWGVHGFRPGVLLLAAVLFAGVLFAPAPQRLLRLLSTPKGDAVAGESIRGYADYTKMAPGQTIAEYYSKYAGLSVSERGPDGGEIKRPLTPHEAARKIRVMVGVLLLAALLWATGALPIGMTALLVGVVMYLFSIFPTINILGSSVVRAGTTIRSGSFQSSCASTKSIPCFFLFERLLRTSNSNFMV